MKRKVAIYARVSTEHEAQISALENQVQYYAELMERHPEFELYDRYIDEGITGTSTKKRPSFLRMMDDAKKGRFDLIITREVSRFARNTVDTLQETRKLKAMGVEVWFTEDNIWTMDDSDGELRLTIMATLAQNESKKTSMRVKAGQMISFKNGVPYGNGNILGYDKVPDHYGEYVINPEQAATVRLIYDLYLAGKGLRAIQWELEKRGLKTAMGYSNWHCSNISKILRNPFYCGIVEYRKQYTPDYLEQKKIKNKGAVERIRVKGTHEPIVTEEEYYQVLGRIHSNSRSNEKTNEVKGKNPPRNVWAKKLCCSCGKNFRRIKYHHVKNELKQYAYKCVDQINKGTYRTRINKGLPVDGICRAQFVQEWKLEVQAAVIFSQFFNNKCEVLRIANEIFNAKRPEIGKNKIKVKERDKLVSEIEKAKKSIERLLDLRLADEISRDEYSRKRAEFDNRIKDLNLKIEELNQAKESEDGVEERIHKMKEVLEGQVDFEIERLPEEVIDAFVEKIIVFEDYMEWHLNFNGSALQMRIEGNKRHPEVKVSREMPPNVGPSTGCNPPFEEISHVSHITL